MTQTTILFSPVGDSDPVRKNNDDGQNYDGPMLHIVRHYRPQKVYLFLTEEMSKKEKKDGRYTQSIKKVSPNCEVEPIYYDDITDPSDFDRFQAVYHQELEKLCRNYRESKILVNISSGTPQMIAALCLEIVSHLPSLRPVQVITPLKRSNTRDKEFDINLAFENLQDQSPASENRCVEPSILSFRKSFLKSRLVTLLKRYNYQAAADLFEPGLSVYPWLKSVLQACDARLNLQYQEGYCLLVEANGVPSEILQLFPEKPASLYEEYFNIMKVQRQCGHLFDFILRITPMVTNLAEDFLSRYLDLEKITSLEKNGIRKFSREKIREFNPDLLKFLDEKTGEFKEHFVNLYGLCHLMGYVADKHLFEQKRYQNDFKQIKKLFGRMNDLENKIRNKLAHEMVSCTEDQLKNQTDFESSQKIMECLEKLLSQVIGKDFRKNYHLYDSLNAILQTYIERDCSGVSCHQEVRQLEGAFL